MKGRRYLYLNSDLFYISLFMNNKDYKSYCENESDISAIPVCNVVQIRLKSFKGLEMY